MTRGAFYTAFAGQGSNWSEEKGIVILGRGAVAFWANDQRRIPEGVPELLGDTSLLPNPFFTARSVVGHKKS